MTKKQLCAALGALLVLAQPAWAHRDGAYSHDYRAVGNQPAWMARVNGTKRISEISIPGTHDTMSIRSGDIWQNQTMTLRQQLDSGLRVFDMRTRHINNEFRMHHGVIAQDTYFNDVLRDINAFLADNPTETVLFRLRSEHTPENNSRSYSATLDFYLSTQGARRYVGASDNPTLDEVRGKFVILQEFSGGDYGIPYGSLDIQDDFSLTTNWDLYDKWTAVKNHFNKSTSGDRNRIYMNYLSGAGGSFPYFVASGHSSPGTGAPRLATGLTTPGWKSSYPDFPRTSCFIGICTISFEGTNTLMADYATRGGFAGMIMADYPGERLINNIINLNDLSDYAYQEFPWGQATNENVNLCSGGTCQVEGDRFTQVEPAPKASLTVVSYNVLRPTAARIQNQVNWLKGKFGPQGPDVILLSETVRGSGCGANRNTAREYAKAFNAYYVNGNEDGDGSSCQTGNAIVSRYPLGNVGLLRFNSQSDSLTGHATAGRSAVYADIKVGDDLIHVYSTHTHHSFGPAGDAIRKKQHEEMVQHAKGKPFTRILGGDLNAIGEIAANPFGLHDISLYPIHNDQYQDAHSGLSTSDRITSEAGIVANDWTLLLDFIYVKGGSVSNSGVCGSECRDSSTLSDHVPIWTDVTFAQSNLNSLASVPPLPENYRLQVETPLSHYQIWNDAGSGADRDVAFWRAHTPRGYYSLGDYIQGNWNTPDVSNLRVVQDDGSGSVAAPVDYVLIWTDKGSGADRDVSIWRGIAPTGYHCLGDVATNGAKPSTEDLRCVWQGFLTQGGARPIWNDKGSGADTDAGFWDAVPNDSNGFYAGTFRTNTHHTNIGNYNDYRVLRSDKTNHVRYRELKVMGKCLEPGGNIQNGSNVFVWDCHGGNWQKWIYEPRTGFIRNKHQRNMCLDSTNGNASWTNVQMHECVDHINLKWDWVGDTIRPRKNPDLALDLLYATPNNGQNIHLYSGNGNIAQVFSWGSH